MVTVFDWLSLYSSVRFSVIRHWRIFGGFFWLTLRLFSSMGRLWPVKLLWDWLVTFCWTRPFANISHFMICNIYDFARPVCRSLKCILNRIWSLIKQCYQAEQKSSKPERWKEWQTWITNWVANPNGKLSIKPNSKVKLDNKVNSKSNGWTSF